MLQQIKLFDWLLEVDIETTVLTYDRIGEEDCACAYCRNYRLASKDFPPELLSILIALGINPGKPIHVSEYVENEDGTHLYSGTYNVVGRIMSGPDYRLITKDTGFWDLLHLSEDIKIGFTGDFDFRSSFPEPIFQIEFFINLPWLLPEKP